MTGTETLYLFWHSLSFCFQFDYVLQATLYFKYLSLRKPIYFLGVYCRFSNSSEELVTENRKHWYTSSPANQWRAHTIATASQWKIHRSYSAVANGSLLSDYGDICAVTKFISKDKCIAVLSLLMLKTDRGFKPDWGDGFFKWKLL